MKQHGRKSIAALAAKMGKPSVVAGEFAKAEPPEGMPERQVAIWRKAVKGEPPQLFTTATAQTLLLEYCRHRAVADEMSDLIDSFDPAWLAEAKGQRRYEWLLRVRRMEAKAAMEIATKLRLTNQSRWQPAAIAAAAEKVDEVGGDDAPIWGERRA